MNYVHSITYIQKYFLFVQYIVQYIIQIQYIISDQNIIHVQYITRASSILLSPTQTYAHTHTHTPTHRHTHTHTHTDYTKAAVDDKRPKLIKHNPRADCRI